jgi:hypothetical protein
MNHLVLGRITFAQQPASTAMNRFLLFAFFAFTLLPFRSQADVLVEGEVDIRVKVTNISDFPDYEFYIEYQDYFYEYGWQPGDISQVAVKEGEEFETGDKGSSSKLYAKDKEGNTFSSLEALGGNTQIDDYQASYIVQEVEITSINGGEIRYKIYLFGMDLGLLLLPIICLGGLVFFFWMRRNPVRQVAV